MAHWDHLWIDLAAATLTDGARDYGVIADAAIATSGSQIAWIGPRTALPGPPDTLATAVHRADGRWVTPGLVDCHTHLVFGGDRADEFERRRQGASYEEIAQAGGGILSTVRATRALSEQQLADASRWRLESLKREGVTTVEIKSGYGLDLETELRILRAARQLGSELRVDVSTTLLAAHALPPEFATQRERYVEWACEVLLPTAVKEGLADSVDVFCERIAFTAAECRRIFERAHSLGLPVRIHAEQLSDSGGARLGASFGALSADHLEYLSEADCNALAQSGTVAVLLPGAFLMLQESRRPPIAALRRAGVRMAIASDCNPGSSPSVSLLAMLPLACAMFQMTPLEALAGVTCHAARALGREQEIGTLEVGKRADFVLWDIGHPREFGYWFGRTPQHQTVRRGRPD